MELEGRKKSNDKDRKIKWREKNRVRRERL